MAPDRRRERRAMACHASALAVAVVAFAALGRPVVWVGALAFLGPLVAGRVLGRGDPFVRAHADAALGFNLSVALYAAAIAGGVRLTTGSPYTVQFLPFFLFLTMLIAFNWVVFALVAMHRAGTGLEFSYPLTLPPLSRALAAVRGLRGPASRPRSG